jgi:hypothetical protein
MPELHDTQDTCNTFLSTEKYLSGCLYEIIRISLLLYNNTVVYPMPPVSGVDVRLTKLLKAALDRFFAVECSMAVYHSAWLVWCLILGGIGGQDDQDRGWYQDHFCRVLEVQPELHKWQSLVDLLSSFLWSGFVLNEEAVEFWSQCKFKGDS